MKRILYHGSDRIIAAPVFGAGKAGNDFGLGFYCTENRQTASEWAVTQISKSANGFVNRYSIETDGLRIINLNNPEYCILHWLAVLLNHREFDAVTSAVYQAKDYIRSVFRVEYQSCDCLIGFRADNSNFIFAQDFIDGKISYSEFNNSVRLGDTGRQFVIKSNRAFDRMVFEGYETAKHAAIYPAAATRDRIALEKAMKQRPGRQNNKDASFGSEKSLIKKRIRQSRFT